MTITLYQFPGLCSRVTMDALEQIGLAYDDVAINTRAGDQHQPAYLAVNPKAKIPALGIDGAILTENPVLLYYLHSQYPAAGLLPVASDPARNLAGLSDLVWCGSALHPLVRQVRRPDKLTSGDPEPVRQDGIAKFSAQCTAIADRIADRWWYGDSWSIVDTYIYWAYSTAALGGLPVDRFPALVEHARRVRARPSFQRVLAREQATLDRLGITDVTL